MLCDLSHNKLTEMEVFGFDAATYAKYCITFFVFSVLPAPDSPVHNIDWSSRSGNENKFKLIHFNPLESAWKVIK